MELTFLGAAGTVTGSCALLTVGGHSLLVDCGLYQGLPELEERNYTHPGVNWPKIEAILLTHAHIDHSGLLPRAVRMGFRGEIYAHPATVDLAQIILLDAADLQKHDAEWLSRKRKRAGKSAVEPLYNKNDVVRMLRRFHRVEYEDTVKVLPGVVAEFRDAGHILGSASIAVDCEENGLKRRIVFSGDVGHHQAPILREPLGFEQADAVVIESTYGDRLHDAPVKRVQALRDIIREAGRSNSKVIIPSFAVGRTQELLYILSDLLNHDEIPHIPVYLDSPMAIEATEVHERHPECFDKETLARIRAGENPFHPQVLHFSNTVAQSRAINRRSGAMVIIAGGGMCEGGRIVHHLKHNLYNPNNFLVFVGYQAVGTLGRIIQNGERRVRILGEEIKVNAKIATIDAFSAHADRDGLLDWLRFLRKPPGVVFVVHGEDKSATAFGESVRQELGFTSYLPRLAQQIDLAALEDVAVGRRIFASLPLPASDHLRQIAARMSARGKEFKPMVNDYVQRLTQRMEAQEPGRKAELVQFANDFDPEGAPDYKDLMKRSNLR
jgi:metallo-beta-lactamase family protein